jgi:hypothetical protein
LQKSRSYLIIAIMAVAIVVIAALVLFGHGTPAGTVNLTSFDNLPVSQSLLAMLAVPASDLDGAEDRQAGDYQRKPDHLDPGEPVFVYEIAQKYH